MGMALLERERTSLAAPTKTFAAPVRRLRLAEPEVPQREHVVPAVPGALEQARRLVAAHPDSTAVFARLARSEHEYGDADAAVRYAETALDLNKDGSDLASFIVAVQVLLQCGRDELAEKWLDSAAAANRDLPSNNHPLALLFAEVAAQRGDIDMALARLSGASDHDASAKSLEGWLLLQQRRHAEAIRALRSAIDSQPNAPDVLTNLGYAYGAVGSIRKAIRSTLAAVELVPSDRTAGLNLAAFLIGQGDVSGALDRVERLLSYHPDDLRLEFAAAEAIAQGGSVVPALYRLQALRTDPRIFRASEEERQELRLNVELLKLELGRTTRGDVFQSAITALERCGYTSPYIARKLAPLAFSVRHVAQLKSAHEELLKRHQRDEMLALEVQIAFLEGAFDRALELAKRWHSYEPFSTGASLMMSFLQAIAFGDYDVASRVSREALRYAPADPYLANNAAFALAMLGQPREARHFLPSDSTLRTSRATGALIQLVSGNADDATRIYDELEAEFRNGGDAEMASLVRLYRYLGEARVGRCIPADPAAAIPEDIRRESNFAIVLRAIEREASRNPTWA